MVSGNGSLLWSAVSMVFKSGEKPDYKKNYVLVKTLQSAAFVSVFLAAAVVSRDILDFWLMLPAFVCCFAGDVILAFIIRSKRDFCWDLSHFNGASVLYPVAGPDAAAGSCRYGVSGHSGDRDFAVTGMGSFHTGRLRPCILVYTFYCIPVCKSMHIAVSIPSVHHMVCAVGSLLFMISDISILFLYFYKNKSRKVHLFNLTTYYVGFFFWRSVLCFIKRGRIFVEKCCIMFRRCQIMHIL